VAGEFIYTMKLEAIMHTESVERKVNVVYALQ